jgi:hypothetical protein
MAYWDKNEFEKSATQIVNAFMSTPKSASLTDLVTKAARDNSLNPEQISRLSRTVNTKAFNAKFASMKEHPDRMVDFEISNEDSVIGSLYKDAAVRTKVASEAYPELPDQLKTHRQPTFTDPSWSGEKLAASVDAAIGTEDPAKQYIHWNKVSSELGIQARQSEIQWNTTMKQLKEAASRVYWDHEDFEKNAIAWFGQRAYPELYAVREMRRMPIPEYTVDKLAAMQEFLVGKTTPEVNLLESAIRARESFVQLKAAHAVATEKTAYFHECVLHG